MVYTKLACENGEEAGSCCAIREFPPSKPLLDGGEGIRQVFAVCEKQKTRGSVYEASNSTVHVGNTAFEPLVQA